MNGLAAQALYIYGTRSVKELMGKNTDEMCLKMSERKEAPADSCTLLTNALRLAVKHAIQRS
jgi:hypothetical protein